MIEFEGRRRSITAEEAVISGMMKRFFRARAKKSYLPITTEEIELIDLLLNGERKEAEFDDKLKAEIDAAVLNISMED